MKIQTIDGKGNGTTVVRVIFAVVCFAVLFLFSQSAIAQGTFYVEEKKENKIYVFNNMQAYKMWKEGGEMGVSITRIGAGPNGETMVFDSNEAIHLYNFKHDLPAEVLIVPEEKKPVLKVTWKDGKTTIDTDLAQLNISNRIQVRWTESEVLGTLLPGSDGDDSIGTFRIRRAKTKFDGWFYNKDLTYELQLNWADSANVLEDANMNFDITKGKKLLMLKAGQYKVPFGRQELTSSGSQQFVDRSAVSNLFARGRDIGFQVWGNPMNGKIDWRLGIFNGNGRTISFNGDGEYQYNGRVTFQPWGDVKYSESDFESTDKLLFAVAAQFDIFHQSVGATATAVAINRDHDTYGFDAVFKYKGLFVFYEHFFRQTDDLVASTQADVNGFVFQGGYFIYKRKIEVAGRYERIDPNEDRDDDFLKEWAIAFNYFYNKHNLKLQGDYRRIENEARDTKFDEFRVQLQFIF
ncbi:OprO/OprP family phosphate-selective porin [bacterium]|nr:OprO/OprP family phosphate-selective porin [bacterium]